MHIAVVGCGHGEIDKIYDVIQNIEGKRGIRVRLLLCCGDFQSVRNMTDLRCMACPLKFQAMHDFHRYYSGEKTAPIPTIFIGGNHEASNYLQELPYGGWVAPNIYFLGNAGVLRFGAIRIAGVSGIFKGHDYLKGRFECPPYDQDTMRSVYHYRNLDFFRLKQIKSPIDIMISHDWPQNIHNYGNINELLRRKPFFREEIEKDQLGSRPLGELLTELKPSYWFSAHLHVKFSAVFPHESENTEAKSEDSAALDSSKKMTKFLALDKVLPRRQFLQIIEVADSDEEDMKLSFDPEWLAILRSTDHLLSVKRNTCFMPGPRGAGGSDNRYEFTPTEEEIEEVCQMLNRTLKVPENFVQTAAPHQSGERPDRAFPIMNPQTTELCQKLGITDPLGLVTADITPLGSLSGAGNGSFTPAPFNPDEISLDTDEEDGDDGDFVSGNETFQSFCGSPSTSSPLLGSRPSPSPSGTLRRKLSLPAPSSTLHSQGDNPSEVQVHNAEDLQLLASVLGNPCFEESSPSTALTEAIKDGPSSLFVIDTSSGEPESKRRRNEALYKTMDVDD